MDISLLAIVVPTFEDYLYDGPILNLIIGTVELFSIDVVALTYNILLSKT